MSEEQILNATLPNGKSCSIGLNGVILSPILENCPIFPAIYELFQKDTREFIGILLEWRLGKYIFFPRWALE